MYSELEVNNSTSQLIADYIHEILVITNRSGEILWVNEKFESLTEYTLDEVKGQKPGAFLQREDVNPHTVAIMRQAIAKGIAFNVNVLNYSKSGRMYWLNVNCKPVFDKNMERVKYFVAIERDITKDLVRDELKLNQFIQEQFNLNYEHKSQINKLVKQQNELSVQLEEVGQLCYTLAHDIKNPLHNIKGLVDLAVIPEDLNDILYQQINKIYILIDKILIGSDKHSGDIKVNVAKTDLVKIMQDLILSYQHQLNYKNIELSFEVKQRIETITDTVLISQVLENLFSNAVKYAPKNTQIEVHFWKKEKYIFMTLANEAPLFEEWQLKAAFSPFQNFQKEHTLKSSGLGLHIVKKYLNLLKGNIEGKKVDTCVIFTVTLPIVL